MKFFTSTSKIFMFCLFLFTSRVVTAFEDQPTNYDRLTVVSFNCGGLPGHYDYLRMVCMGKIMQRRYCEEPYIMNALEKIQEAAERISFTNDSYAQKEWDRHGYSGTLALFIVDPTFEGTMNNKWYNSVNEAISPYNAKKVVLRDEEARQAVIAQIKTMKGGKGDCSISSENLGFIRKEMAKAVFHNHLQDGVHPDIICLQEANNIQDHAREIIPKTYEYFFDGKLLPNGVMWDKRKFRLKEKLKLADRISSRGVALLLEEIKSARVIAVLSAHLPGGDDPFIERRDQQEGQMVLSMFLDCLEDADANVIICGMDANVTATHPMMKYISARGYMAGASFEPTCSHPSFCINTKIDWIIAKSSGLGIRVDDIRIPSVPLNVYQVNFSDHAPIAASIAFTGK